MATSYPPVGFHFIVTIADLQMPDGAVPFIRAQEVKGLSATISTEEIQEGGENTFTHKLPKGVTYQPLVITRGMVSGSVFVEWIKLGVEQFRFYPVNLLVTLLDEQHLPLEYWFIANAYPIKIGTSDLNAQDNKIVIETLELQYQYFRRGSAVTNTSILSQLQSLVKI
ncbi:MAG: phage tail protein [Bacteroidia bacterium]|jgi:phage tail-like protein|nr:phage tail protein [Bacteroidia bacterium]